MKTKKAISRKAVIAVLEKADHKSKVEKEIQVHRGGKVFTQRRMVNVDEAVASRPAKKPDEKPKPGAGNPGAEGQKPASPFAGKVQSGDTVSFEWEGTPFTGQAAGSGGKDGLRVMVQGMKYEVPWERVQKVEKPKAANPKRETPDNTSGKEWVDPARFNAAEWKRRWQDSKATADEQGVEYILNSIGNEANEVREKIIETDARNKAIEEAHELTHEKYRIGNEDGAAARYTPERERLHWKILHKLLDPNKIESAVPEEGKQPTFIMLGGRGGSGKSWFKMDPDKNPGGGLYDPNKFVILDADEIKQEIPEYDGWNANQVHEESSDILEQALEFCLKKGLNVVLDQTMKTASKAIAKMVEFNQNGYRTEAHYMHLPVQEAAKRAIYRFKNSKKGPYQGRYVPVGAVLRNTTNEESFDQVRQYADAWSFRDNNVPQGTQPILISEGKNGRKLQKSLVKSFESAYNKDGRQADMEKNLKENKPYDYLDPEHWEYDGGTGKIGEIKSPYIKKKMDELAAQVFGNKKKQTIKA